MEGLSQTEIMQDLSDISLWLRDIELELSDRIWYLEWRITVRELNPWYDGHHFWRPNLIRGSVGKEIRRQLRAKIRQDRKRKAVDRAWKKALKRVVVVEPSIDL